MFKCDRLLSGLEMLMNEIFTINQYNQLVRPVDKNSMKVVCEKSLVLNVYSIFQWHQTNKENNLACDIGIAPAGTFDIIGIDVIGSWHAGIVRQGHSSAIN